MISVNIDKGVSICTAVMLQPETFITLKELQDHGVVMSLLFEPQSLQQMFHALNYLEFSQEMLSIASMRYHYLPTW